MLAEGKHSAGLDEVGRGSLFGPVFAGAVILNESAKEQLLKAGLTDSKALSAKKREALVPLIKGLADDWALGQSSALEIDLIGIRSATEVAMIRALQKLTQPLDLVLIDGVLPLRKWLGPQENIIKGDSKNASISAASVLAKQARDKLIRRIASKFPEYGLEKHVGYGTVFHRKALKAFGPSPLHRKSFLKKILIT